MGVRMYKTYLGRRGRRPLHNCYGNIFIVLYTLSVQGQGLYQGN